MSTEPQLTPSRMLLNDLEKDNNDLSHMQSGHSELSWISVSDSAYNISKVKKKVNS